VLQQMIGTLPTATSSGSLELGIAYMLLLVLFMWVENWGRAQGQLMTQLMAQRGTAAICHLLLRKAVWLRVGVAPPGVESSLIGGDMIAKHEYLSVFVVGSMSMFTLASAIVTLLVIIGWTALLGILVLCLCFVVAANIGLRVKRLADCGRRAQDATVAAISELIHGAKLCKLQQWETPMVEYVIKKRRAELKLLRQLRTLLSTMMMSKNGGAGGACCCARFRTSPCFPWHHDWTATGSAEPYAGHDAGPHTPDPLRTPRARVVALALPPYRTPPRPVSDDSFPMRSPRAGCLCLPPHSRALGAGGGVDDHAGCLCLDRHPHR
jgi:hypothetical protein